MARKADTCNDRIDDALNARLDDLSKLWAAFLSGRDDDDLGCLNDYGLCFGYVAPGTYDSQPEGYFQYQLSWGGPSDEFRYYVNPDLTCHRVEYWFLDWFDGSYRVLEGDAYRLLLDLFDWFGAAGLVHAAHAEAAY